MYSRSIGLVGPFMACTVSLGLIEASI